MSEAETAEEDKPFLPRWVFYLAVPGMLGPVFIFGFILFTEQAHDPERCPYESVTRRVIEPGVELVEDKRRCLPEVEEHRYTLKRGDHMRVLGHRRFEPAAFQGPAYRWAVKVVETGEVAITIEVDGHPVVMFREGTEKEHLTGKPRDPRRGAD